MENSTELFSVVCHVHVLGLIDLLCLSSKKKKRKKGSGKMCLLSILILELHDFAVLISFQLLTLNLCIDKYSFVSLSPPKRVPLTAPACLVQCNSASCSFGVLLLICGFRYSWYCFPFMNCYSMLCKMINKVNNELRRAKNSCVFCVWLSDKLSIP